MLDETQNNANATNETVPETEPVQEQTVDTGRDVKELRETIQALRPQTDALKKELQQKAPTEEKAADFGAYFKQYMK